MKRFDELPIGVPAKPAQQTFPPFHATHLV
jgi:hypothetical protein